MSAPQELVRRLGAWDAALITIGAVIGTGIFLTTGDMAKAMPHTGLVLLVWVVSGLLTLTGALTYAELGAMYPRAGGMYVFLREAYGPLWGFLYGWGAFLVIMSGGIAAIAVGFGEYLGASCRSGRRSTRSSAARSWALPGRSPAESWRIRLPFSC